MARAPWGAPPVPRWNQLTSKMSKNISDLLSLTLQTGGTKDHRPPNVTNQRLKCLISSCLEPIDQCPKLSQISRFSLSNLVQPERHLCRREVDLVVERMEAVQVGRDWRWQERRLSAIARHGARSREEVTDCSSTEERKGFRVTLPAAKTSLWGN